MNTTLQKIQDNSSTILRCLTGATLLWVAQHFVVNESLLKQLLWAGPLPFLTFVLGHIIIATHLAGGIMLIFGFVTRIAALIQLPFILGALAIHLSIESVPEHLAALYLAPPMLLAILTISAFGPSKLSVDHLIGLDSPENDRNWTDDEPLVLLLKSSHARTDKDLMSLRTRKEQQLIPAQATRVAEEYECPIEQARRQAA